MPKTTKPHERSPSGKPKAQPKSAKGGDLSEADLDHVAGGATKHPAKVTVPDLKLG
jgi:hypothetical protein